MVGIEILINDPKLELIDRRIVNRKEKISFVGLGLSSQDGLLVNVIEAMATGLPIVVIIEVRNRSQNMNLKLIEQ